MTHDHSSMNSAEVLTGGGAWATGGSSGRGLIFDPGSPPPPVLFLSLVSMMERTWSAMESRERPERVLLLLRRTSLRISLKSSLCWQGKRGEKGLNPKRTYQCHMKSRVRLGIYTVTYLPKIQVSETRKGLAWYPGKSMLHNICTYIRREKWAPIGCFA